MRYTRDNPLRVIEICAGYGSQAMALERLKRDFPDFDYKVVAISEIDKYAIAAYKAVHGEVLNLGDLTKIDWTTVPKCDLITYSTPCQSISSAGKQEGLTEGSGTASSILWSCREAIRVLRPKYLLQENVSALVSKKFMPQFSLWARTLEEMGYKNFWTLLNAKDYGVPQNRLRVFMVSMLDVNAYYEFPEPFPLEKRLKDVLEENVDESYYLTSPRIEELLAKLKTASDESHGTSHTSLAGKQDRVIQVANIADEKTFSNPQISRIYDTNGISPTLDTCGGGNREPKILLPIHTEEMPPCFIGNTDQFVAEPRVVAMRGRGADNAQTLELGSETVSNALTTVQKDNLLLTPEIFGISVHPLSHALEFDGEKSIRRDVSPTLRATDHKCPHTVWERRTLWRIRKLTPRECFRLMDVSESDIDKIQAAGISKTQQYKLAGNSIAVSCLYHIFRKMFIDTEPTQPQQLELF